MNDVLTVSSAARKIEEQVGEPVLPTHISSLFYRRKLPDSACPIVDGRRIIPISFLPTIVDGLRKDGKLSPEEHSSSPEESQNAKRLSDQPIHEPHESETATTRNAETEVRRSKEDVAETCRNCSSPDVITYLPTCANGHIPLCLACAQALGEASSRGNPNATNDLELSDGHDWDDDEDA